MPDWGSSKFDHVAEMVVKLLENEMFVVPSSTVPREGGLVSIVQCCSFVFTIAG